MKIKQKVKNFFQDRKNRLALTILFALLIFAYFGYAETNIIANQNFVYDEIKIYKLEVNPMEKVYDKINITTTILPIEFYYKITTSANYWSEFNIIFGIWGYWIPYVLLFGLTLFFFLLFRQFEVSRDLVLLLIAGFDTALIVLTLAYFINPIWTIIGITLSLIYIVYRVVQERREEID
jgi:hypothetical protein